MRVGTRWLVFLKPKTVSFYLVDVLPDISCVSTVLRWGPLVAAPDAFLQ